MNRNFVGINVPASKENRRLLLELSERVRRYTDWDFVLQNVNRDGVRSVAIGCFVIDLDPVAVEKIRGHLRAALGPLADVDAGFGPQMVA